MPSGMVYWRFKSSTPTPYWFGYATDAGSGLVRMGCYNGDTAGGSIVDPKEIEWRKHA